MQAAEAEDVRKASVVKPVLHEYKLKCRGAEDTMLIDIRGKAHPQISSEKTDPAEKESPAVVHFYASVRRAGNGWQPAERKRHPHSQKMLLSEKISRKTNPIQ
jgi:hypothetical protein